MVRFANRRRHAEVEPVLPDHLVLVSTEDFAALAVDERDAAVGVDGDDLERIEPLLAEDARQSVREPAFAVVYGQHHGDDHRETDEQSRPLAWCRIAFQPQLTHRSLPGSG